MNTGGRVGAALACALPASRLIHHHAPPPPAPPSSTTAIATNSSLRLLRAGFAVLFASLSGALSGVLASVGLAMDERDVDCVIAGDYRERCASTIGAIARGKRAISAVLLSGVTRRCRSSRA